MGLPAARQGDEVKSIDIHIDVIPGPPVSESKPHLFEGILNAGLSSNVKIMGMPAATVGSTAASRVPHVPPPGTGFLNPPANMATIKTGSATVNINGKPAARNGDEAETCNDVPDPLRRGRVVAISTVRIG